ncbi:hypothetical protein JW935_01195 [candidate division KSB1 bacterium]|nr:hypothetical protein [candidate division KSB1 bacterium]
MSPVTSLERGAGNWASICTTWGATITLYGTVFQFVVCGMIRLFCYLTIFLTMFHIELEVKMNEQKYSIFLLCIVMILVQNLYSQFVLDGVVTDNGGE